MQKVLTAEQMREVDRLTTEKYGIPSILLMENAAHAVARVITEKFGGSVRDKSIVILCGKGNNGGDGAALARVLLGRAAKVHVVLFGSSVESKGDARTNFDMIKRITASDYRLKFEEVNLTEDEARNWWKDFIHNFAITKVDCIVDSIFGTGFKGEISGSLCVILETLWTNINRRFGELMIVSIDLPSGFDADEADTNSWHFFPDSTIAFTSPKRANVLPPASKFNGELIVANIGSPQNLIDDQPSHLYLAQKDDASWWVRHTGFSSSDYKNKRGHALLIAGSECYSGAAVLAGDAAMRSGVGLVTVVTPKSSKDSVASRVLPEVMIRGVAETDGGAIAEAAFDETGDLLSKADSVAIGCGLSQDEGTKKFVELVVATRRQPTVVDADALNLLSPFAGFDANGESQPPLILTPHEGEFMRLLGTDDKNAIEDRVASVREFATKHTVILVLKGERVLIGEPGGKVIVNPTGNSGLGKAGNGDTLTGILAGFVAQAVAMKIDIFETVVAAVYVAGMAGDIAEKKFGKRVMTASDVRECLTEVFKALEAGE